MEVVRKAIYKPPLASQLDYYRRLCPCLVNFGNSIFSYYQAFRIKEAARLLTEGTLTVSEVGNQLGFTNLNHFSRVFYDHIGTRILKQFSRLR